LRPLYGEGCAIVHLGVGAFHRAHQAVATERAMAATGDDGWGIVGVSQRSNAVIRDLAAQDHLFTVSERGPHAADPLIVAAIRRGISARDDPTAVRDSIAAADSRIVSITVTEKGYRRASPGGGLDLRDPEVRADLQGRPPQTTIGQLVAGLAERARLDNGPITVLSCDNLTANGDVVARLVGEFVSARSGPDADVLAAWIGDNARFPNSMVDRIVPATTSADLELVASRIGLRDSAAVICEPYFQWVVEDRFAAGRPAWDRVGVTFSDEVGRWEGAKLQLLNATHSLFAYLGLQSGAGTIADVARDEVFAASARLMMTETIGVLDAPTGVDLESYALSVRERFSNASLRHTTAQVGADGSQKVPLRLLPTCRDLLARGSAPTWSALAVAGWMHHVATADAAALNDPLAAELMKSLPADRTPAGIARALLGRRAVFDEALAGDPVFENILVHWLDAFRFGPEAVKEAIRHGI
jgi:fructuronate reductase